MERGKTGDPILLAHIADEHVTNGIFSQLGQCQYEDGRIYSRILEGY